MRDQTGDRAAGHCILGGSQMIEIMLSVRPIWSRLIFSGQKDIEVRKNIPHGKMPIKVYNYETKNGDGAGAVTGEYIISSVYPGYRNSYGGRSCLSDAEILDYGHGKAYGLKISKPVKYDSPVPLSRFGLFHAPQNWCYVKG